jgi:hypothetical protein
MIPKEIRDLRKVLFEATDGCVNETLDIANMKFISSDEEMLLVLQNGTDQKYHFKMNRADPRNADTVHAHKQFCKYVKVPYSFFRDNRPHFRDAIVNAWQDGMRMQEHTAMKIFRLRKGSEHQTIRALLPDNYTCLDNYEILDALIRDTEKNLELVTFSGESRDSAIFHARILIGDEFEVDGNRLRMGISITASELGSSDLVLDCVVHCVEDGVGLIVSYGGESFFETSYARIQPNEIRDIISAIPDRIADEWQICQQTIMQNKWLGVDESCRVVSGIKKLPNNVKRDIRMECDSCGDDIKSPFDFARHLSIVGMGYEIRKRLEIERHAGRFLNLSLEKL